jgi:sodium/bile acid cotransporter 7
VQLQQSGLANQLSGIAIVWLTCIGLHVIALAVANAGAVLLRMPRADRIGAVISGGQKTLPIGVYLATSPEAFGGPAVVDGLPVPFAVFPILMFHASQLFIDTLVADRFAHEGRLLAAAPIANSPTSSSSTIAPSSDCDPAHGSPATDSD